MVVRRRRAVHGRLFHGSGTPAIVPAAPYRPSVAISRP